MPAKTKKQARYMAACSNPNSRKKMKSCPPVKVAKKFRSTKRHT